MQIVANVKTVSLHFVKLGLNS